MAVFMLLCCSCSESLCLAQSWQKVAAQEYMMLLDSNKAVWSWLRDTCVHIYACVCVYPNSTLVTKA